MKACVIQPYYSLDYEKSEQCFQEELSLLDRCDSSMDLIVLPELCDMPAYAATSEQRLKSHLKFGKTLLNKASDTAKRCRAMVFLNALSQSPDGYRNTTYAFDREGKLAGTYDKEHLTPNESRFAERSSEYTFDYRKPTLIEMEGLRFCFLTCYDFYFYEYLGVLARQKPDLIIGCSHQRSDTHSALAMLTEFAAYHTNAYVVRASVSLGEDSPLGGMSCIVAPTGKILAKMDSRIGMTTAEFDPMEKYLKPAGFGNPPAPHWAYIEEGRRPWLYRPGGSAIVRNDEQMLYPRVCAHRGFNTIAPENSMPAFGAAVAMGAQEIEFDLWYTKDDEIVSIHDKKLGRISDGEGLVYEHTYAQLLGYDFGVKYGAEFQGLRILRFEQILQKLACQTVMNIHLKTPSNDSLYEPRHLQKIIDLIYQYDCEKYVYFMSGNDHVLALAQKMAPDIARCVGAGAEPEAMVERAVRYDCKKIQLFHGKFTPNMVQKAHEKGIVCNVFYADDAATCEEYLNMGIDTILTNDYGRIAQLVQKRKKYRFGK